MKHPVLLLLLAWLSPFVLSAAESSELPEYRPGHKVSGVIRTWGSPHLGGLLRR